MSTGKFENVMCFRCYRAPVDKTLSNPIDQDNETIKLFGTGINDISNNNSTRLNSEANLPNLHYEEPKINRAKWIDSTKYNLEKPWIKIIKKVNKLPEVKLVSRVLYCLSDVIKGLSRKTPEEDKPPYTDCARLSYFKYFRHGDYPRQDGSIEGFPLFDVERTPKNWPIWHGGPHPVYTKKIQENNSSANKYLLKQMKWNLGVPEKQGKMMYDESEEHSDCSNMRFYYPPDVIDLSANKNLIVIDFRGKNMRWTDMCKNDFFGNSYTNSSENVGLKYLILRIKSSKEEVEEEKYRPFMKDDKQKDHTFANIGEYGIFNNYSKFKKNEVLEDSEGNNNWFGSGYGNGQFCKWYHTGSGPQNDEFQNDNYPFETNGSVYENQFEIPPFINITRKWDFESNESKSKVDLNPEMADTQVTSLVGNGQSYLDYHLAVHRSPRLNDIRFPADGFCEEHGNVYNRLRGFLGGSDETSLSRPSKESWDFSGAKFWVTYTFTCDIVNPYKALDFSTKFLYTNSLDPSRQYIPGREAIIQTNIEGTNNVFANEKYEVFNTPLAPILIKDDEYFGKDLSGLAWAIDNGYDNAEGILLHFKFEDAEEELITDGLNYYNTWKVAKHSNHNSIKGEVKNYGHIFTGFPWIKKGVDNVRKVSEGYENYISVDENKEHVRDKGEFNMRLTLYVDPHDLKLSTDTFEHSIKIEKDEGLVFSHTTSDGKILSEKYRIPCFARFTPSFDLESTSLNHNDAQYRGIIENPLLDGFVAQKGFAFAMWIRFDEFTHGMTILHMTNSISEKYDFGHHIWLYNYSTSEYKRGIGIEIKNNYHLSKYESLDYNFFNPKGQYTHVIINIDINGELRLYRDGGFNMGGFEIIAKLDHGVGRTGEYKDIYHKRPNSPFWWHVPGGTQVRLYNDVVFMHRSALGGKFEHGVHDHVHGNNFAFIGAMRDFRLYGRILTPTEIKYIFNPSLNISYEEHQTKIFPQWVSLRNLYENYLDLNNLDNIGDKDNFDNSIHSDSYSNLYSHINIWPKPRSAWRGENKKLNSNTYTAGITRLIGGINMNTGVSEPDKMIGGNEYFSGVLIKNSWPALGALPTNEIFNKQYNGKYTLQLSDQCKRGEVDWSYCELTNGYSNDVYDNSWSAIGIKYKLNNILWCSLRSPRHLDILCGGKESYTELRKIDGLWPKTKRYIPNFIDNTGYIGYIFNNTSNLCNGNVYLDSKLDTNNLALLNNAFIDPKTGQYLSRDEFKNISRHMGTCRGGGYVKNYNKNEWVPKRWEDINNDIDDGFNTIHLPRNSAYPYYFKEDIFGQIINDNTGKIDYENNAIYSEANVTQKSIQENSWKWKGGKEKKGNYEIFNLDDGFNKDLSSNYFDVYFKLLIPPTNNTKFKIKYTFGKQKNSTVTFYRWKDMDGSEEETGGDPSDDSEGISAFENWWTKNNAKRDKETIVLTWNGKKNDISGADADCKMQKIRLFDIRAGKWTGNPEIEFDPNNDYEIFNDLSDVKLSKFYYNIIANVYQMRLINPHISNKYYPKNSELGFDQSKLVYSYDLSYVPANVPIFTYNNVYWGSCCKPCKSGAIEIQKAWKWIQNPYQEILSNWAININSKTHIAKTNSDLSEHSKLFEYKFNDTGNIIRRNVNSSDFTVNDEGKKVDEYSSVEDIFKISVSEHPEKNQLNGRSCVLNLIEKSYVNLKDEKNAILSINGNLLYNVIKHPKINQKFLRNTIGNKWELLTFSPNEKINDNTEMFSEYMRYIFDNNEADENELFINSYDDLINFVKMPHPDIFNLQNIILDYWKYNDIINTVGEFDDDWKIYKNQIKIQSIIKVFGIRIDVAYMLIIPDDQNKVKEIIQFDVSGNRLVEVIDDKPTSSQKIKFYVKGGQREKLIENSGIFSMKIINVDDGIIKAVECKKEDASDYEFNITIQKLASNIGKLETFLNKGAGEYKIEFLTNVKAETEFFNLKAQIIGGKLQEEDITGTEVIINYVKLKTLKQIIFQNEKLEGQRKCTNCLLSDDNKTIRLMWIAYDEGDGDKWCGSCKDEGELLDEKDDEYILWTIEKQNIHTNKKWKILEKKPLKQEKYGDYWIWEYSDTDFNIYDKFKYTIIGTYFWKLKDARKDGLRLSETVQCEVEMDPLEIDPIFICKNNQFPYGRYNTTSTNLKSYPHLLSTKCLIDYTLSRSRGGTKNIYGNTSNQLTKKQIYVALSKSNFRPFR